MKQKMKNKNLFKDRGGSVVDSGLGSDTLCYRQRQ